MNSDYEVSTRTPLLKSDEIEVQILRRRNFQNYAEIRQHTSDIKTKPKKHKTRRLILKTVTWLSPKFPYGSKKRHLAKRLVYQLPHLLRNQIIMSLSPSNVFEIPPSTHIEYLLDFGFGIPTSSKPEVSIIVPVHNNWWTTYKCLRRLQTGINSTKFEVIVVDDASSDLTKFALKSIRGITVVTSSKNQGYLLSTNLGASFANPFSKYLVLLNNDTEPLDFWIDELKKAFDHDSEIAIAGSCLLDEQGLIQEAGGQIFDSGNAWNLGRGQNRNNGMFKYVREVDYCSAASIMVDREFWNSVGGFDETYKPAYCEDSDLAMNAWLQGRKVVYVPTSVVIHAEGVSHGKNPKFGIKSYQELNKRKLFAKWELELRDHWPDEGKPRFESKRLSRGIVVLCDRQLPAKYRDAGSIRTRQIIDHVMALNFHVIVACLDNSTTPLDVEEMQSLGVEIHFNHDQLYETLALRRDRLRAAWMVREEVYDHFYPKLKEINPRIVGIADLMDLKIEETGKVPGKVVSSQVQIAKRSDVTILVSETESKMLRNQAQVASLHTIWSEYDPKGDISPWDGRNGILFIGGFRHLPNVEGIRWFAREIMPILRSKKFEEPVYVIGSGLNTDISRELVESGLTVLGPQDNLEIWYSKVKVSIAPLLSGAGRKGKIGEALSYGIPVVATEVGAEGFESQENSGILVTQELNDMADHLLTLTRNMEEWNRQSGLARMYCANFLSSNAMRKKIEEVLYHSREGREDESTI